MIHVQLDESALAVRTLTGARADRHETQQRVTETDLDEHETIDQVT
jgi:hypothetical protein